MKPAANPYDGPVEIAKGVFWVGFVDTVSGLHCNPYCIVEGDEAVVIDGGSRPDFPTVMLKILQAGVKPSSIRALIYQHYDPDLCGSIPNFEDIINRDDLMIISDRENNIFIRHYYVSSRVYSLESKKFSFTFASGRKLEFFKTPYCHSVGSFITFDSKTGVLFTSDLFGSISRHWDLFLDLEQACQTCPDPKDPCPQNGIPCPIPGVLDFHRKLMTSNRALRNSMRVIAEIDFKIVAPQHGSVLGRKQDVIALTRRLVELDDVGVDGMGQACGPECEPENIMRLFKDKAET